MKKYLYLLLILFCLLAANSLFLTGEAVAANKFWWASCRTGGGDCLDGIDGADLMAGDGAIVMMDAGSNTPVRYEYRLHASSTAESDPIVIAPDSNPGTLRWHLVSAFAVSFQSPSVDGSNRIDLAINSSRSPAAGKSELYPEGTSTTSRYKMSNQVASAATEHTIVGADTIDTFTNKTFDADGTGNSISNIENADIKSAAAIDATKIADGTVTSAEFQYINSLASNAQDQINLKAAKADPVFTGSLALPQGANPTTDAAGEMAVDTSAGAGGGIRVYTDAAYTIPVWQTQCFTIKGPTETDDYRVWRSAQNITIRAAHCVQVGGTNVIGHFDECDANGANCATIDSTADMTCLTTNVNDDGALSNGTIDAGDYIQWHTTSVSGTITELIVCFDYTVDQVN